MLEERCRIIRAEILDILRVEPVSLRHRLRFNLCDFTYFSSSENGIAMPFGNSRILATLIAVPYVLACEAIFFRKNRLFFKLGKRVAGILALAQEPNRLYISTVAVAPELRRLGIASFILNYAETVAEKISKPYLELSVLKKNLPARKLYQKHSFKVKKEKRRTYLMAKNVDRRAALRTHFKKHISQGNSTVEYDRLGH
jgi:GNAT superfamily N-acetyltransferase